MNVSQPRIQVTGFISEGTTWEDILHRVRRDRIATAGAQGSFGKVSNIELEHWIVHFVCYVMKTLICASGGVLKATMLYKGLELANPSHKPCFLFILGEEAREVVERVLCKAY